MFVFGHQLHYPRLIFNLLFILHEIHPGFLNSVFLSLEKSFLNAVASLIFRHMILTASAIFAFLT